DEVVHRPQRLSPLRDLRACVASARAQTGRFRTPRTERSRRAAGSRLTTASPITYRSGVGAGAAELVPSVKRRFTIADPFPGIDEHRFTVAGDSAATAHRPREPWGERRGGDFAAQAEQQLVIIAAANSECRIVPESRAICARKRYRCGIDFGASSAALEHVSQVLPQS